MFTLFIFIHALICVLLIIVVLMQSAKGEGLAGAFGGGGSQSVFGPRGAATILTKATTICAVLFMLTSFGLWIMSGKTERSVVSGEEAPAAETAVTGTKQEADPLKKQPAAQKEEEKKDPEKKAPESEQKN